jgi:TatD DNase family protein
MSKHLVRPHCHLDFPDLIENEAVLARMADNGVTHALCVSVKLETLPGVIGLAERHANVFASVGVHRQRRLRGARRSAPARAGRPSQSGGDRRDRARLLLAQGRARMAAGALSHPHPRRAPLRKPLIIHTRDRPPTRRLMREEGAGEAAA